ncbi:MAG: serine hydrolase domain-containing protein [Planctomycetales bacterium]
MPAPVIERLTDELNERLRAVQERERLPGLAVGIVDDQNLVWTGNVGFADLEGGRPPDCNSLYRVASITKTLTATAIVQLRDEGKLDLDDPLRRHLPEFAQAQARVGTVDQVTLRRLMTHHSGLVTEAPLPGWDAQEFGTREALLAALPAIEVVIPADSAFKYSNLAFALLGEVVSRISGMPFERYLQTALLDPLAMSSSVWELSDEPRHRLARGYYPLRSGHGFEPAPYVRLNGMAPCGQLHSSVTDLARWISLQFCGGDSPRGGRQVLSGSSLNEMHRPVLLEADWSIGYCLGWRAIRAGDRVYHGHGGGLHGYASQIQFSLPHKLGVICLANVWPHPGLQGAATEIAEMLIKGGWKGAVERPRSAASSTPPEWDALCGLYEAAPGIVANVVVRHGALRLEPSRLGSYLLHAPARLDAGTSPDAFIVRGGRASGETAEFRRGPDGIGAQIALAGFVYRRLATTDA